MSKKDKDQAGGINFAQNIAALFSALNRLAQSSGAAVVTVTHGEQQDLNAQVWEVCFIIHHHLIVMVPANAPLPPIVRSPPGAWISPSPPKC